MFLASGVAAAVAGPAVLAQPLPKLRIVSFPGPSISSHSKVIIKNAGLDRKHGWELDWVIRTSSESYYNDFISGAFDSFDYSGLPVLANFYNKGVPFKIVQATMRGPFPMMAASNVSAKRLRDLKGKRLGVDRGSYIMAYMAAMARADGLDIEKDFSVVNVSLLQARARLIRGDFDAAPMVFEHGLQFVSEVPGYRMLFDAAAEFAQAIGVKEVYQYHAIRNDWTDKHHALIPNLHATYKELGDFIVANPERAIAYLAMSNAAGGANFPPELGRIDYVTGTKEGYKTVWLSRPVAQLKTEIERELKAYVDLGLIAKMPDAGILYEGK
ncbi:MAG: ABC transporter substrate-binding protein [Lautropia sp.]